MQTHHAVLEESIPRPVSIESRVNDGALSYRFGDFELDLAGNQLRRHGATVTIAPKSLAVLAYLVCHRDRLVPRTELLERVWPDVIVGKGSLPQAIWEVRRALGDPRGASRFIRTKYNCGYRFVAAVEAAFGRGPRSVAYRA